MRTLFSALVLIAAISCNNDDDPSPNGCVLATSPDNIEESFGCFTRTQFDVALANDGKLGSGTNTIHPDWTAYTKHRWELCDACK